MYANFTLLILIHLFLLLVLHLFILFCSHDYSLLLKSWIFLALMISASSLFIPMIWVCVFECVCVCVCVFVCLQVQPRANYWSRHPAWCHVVSWQQEWAPPALDSLWPLWGRTESGHWRLVLWYLCHSYSHYFYYYYYYYNLTYFNIAVYHSYS